MKETTAVVEWSLACVETRMCACTVRGDHLGRPQPAILPLRNHLKTRWFPRWFPRWFLDIGGWFPGKRWVVRWGQVGGSPEVIEEESRMPVSRARPRWCAWMTSPPPGGPGGEGCAFWRDCHRGALSADDTPMVV